VTYGYAPELPEQETYAIDSDVDSEIKWAHAEADTLRGMAPIAMRAPATIEVDADVKAVTLLRFEDTPAAVLVSRGRGAVIVLASGSMLRNSALPSGEGGVLFARLIRSYAPQGPILFDEYHLGVGERRSMIRYFRQQGATIIALQLLFIAALWLWRNGARFGGIRVRPPSLPGGVTSYVQAMGNLFRKADDPNGAIALVAKEAIARIAATHHLPITDAWSLVSALTRRGHQNAAIAVQDIVEQSESVKNDSKKLLTAIHRIDEALAKACDAS
jgi:hypothetical protein